MRRFLVVITIVIFCNALIINGQIDTSNTSLILEKLYGGLIAAKDDQESLKINDSVRLIIESYVLSDTVFNHRFNNLRYLGQITSPDSLMKIITWNLILRESPNRYYCYFVRKSDTGRENTIYRLAGVYREEPVNTDTTYSESDWYGALYYDLRSCRYGGDHYWILLGIDYGNQLITRKIIDVMNFTPEGKIVFGKRWFTQSDEMKQRVVLEYAFEAVVTLRFLSDTSIVFDHLVPIAPQYINNRQYYGPDYSYDAYIFDKGVWRLVTNIDVRNKE